MSEARPVEAAVMRTRAALALGFVLARYVPVPFLDDVLRERVARVVVARAAASLGHALEKDEVARLAASSEGCLGCLGAVLWAPLRLLFYPVAVLLGLRHASRDLVEVFALGRTIERVVSDGRYPLAATPEARLAYARDVRVSFDRARRGLDLHAVAGLLSVSLGPLRRIAPFAFRMSRRLWHGDDDATTESSASAPASRLAAALEDPRMKALLAEIDRRFDEALLAERARSAGS